MIAERFDKLPAAAEGCDALVATGLFPVVASTQSVAEKLGIRYVFAVLAPWPEPADHDVVLAGIGVLRDGVSAVLSVEAGTPNVLFDVSPSAERPTRQRERQ